MSAEALNHKRDGVGPSRSRMALAIAISVVGIGWIWQRYHTPASAPTETVSPAIRTVTALGRLEPAGEVVYLAAPTSAQENRIQALQVQAGEHVEAGQTVAILDNHDSLQAALSSAQAQVRIAQAGLAQVQAGAKAGELQAQEAEIARLVAEAAGTLATQQATIDRVQAEVNNAQLEYDRYHSLYQQGAVSASERDTRALTLTTAQQQLQAAQSELARLRTTSQEQIEQATATLDQLAEVRPVDVALANADVAAAMAAVAEAESTLDKAYVRSPQAGQILKIHTRPGEIVGDEGIVTLGQTRQMMALAEVYQSDIPHIRIGQTVSVTSPVIGGELSGSVERIGLQVEQQQGVGEDPAANIDAKVVEVHIRLDDAASAQVAGLTHLQVTVRITMDRLATVPSPPAAPEARE